MRRVLFALPLLVGLVFAAAAHAGGWATVGLSSTPAGTQPGDPWDVRLTVLQHGRTPLDDLQPTITIRSGDREQTFSATPTGRPGVYAASVTFPTAGTWTYEVDDGFIHQVHSFPPVEIGAPATATTTEGGGVDGIWLAFGGLAFLLAGVLLLARRHRHHEPQAA